MNLVVMRRALLAVDVVDELDQITTRANTVFKKEHDPQTGVHTDVTADSVETLALTLNDTSQTTVGAAGGASALPATPTGYIPVTINGVEYVVPFYAKS
jgi:hypothetical protein